ncbi:MAG: RpoL/Rpb11 RNA polymerase subunit family protein [Candidatus Odinarchaeia archaeon]
MEIEVISQSKDEIKLKIVGEGHTLLNLLKSAIFEDESVSVAGYDKEHPMVEKAILHVKTNGDKDPVQIIRESAKKIIKKIREFRDKFQDALK